MCVSVCGCVCESVCQCVWMCVSVRVWGGECVWVRVYVSVCVGGEYVCVGERQSVCV